MKKRKSSIIVLSCSESSGDETEKAKPKIDKEELRKYLQNSDKEDESDKETSPKKSKKLVKKRKLLLTIILIKINQRNLSKKIHPKNISSKVVISKDFKKRQKNLAPHLSTILKEKNNKYMVEYNGQKIHFGSVKTEDYLTHKDPDRRDKYLTKAMKISNKDGQLTHQLPTYPNYWSIKLLN